MPARPHGTGTTPLFRLPGVDPPLRSVSRAGKAKARDRRCPPLGSLGAGKSAVSGA